MQMRAAAPVGYAVGRCSARHAGPKTHLIRDFAAVAAVGLFLLPAH